MGLQFGSESGMQAKMAGGDGQGGLVLAVLLWAGTRAGGRGVGEVVVVVLP